MVAACAVVIRSPAWKSDHSRGLAAVAGGVHGRSAAAGAASTVSRAPLTVIRAPSIGQHRPDAAELLDPGQVGRGHPAGHRGDHVGHDQARRGRPGEAVAAAAAGPGAAAAGRRGSSRAVRLPWQRPRDAGAAAGRAAATRLRMAALARPQPAPLPRVQHCDVGVESCLGSLHSDAHGSRTDTRACARTVSEPGGAPAPGFLLLWALRLPRHGPCIVGRAAAGRDLTVIAGTVAGAATLPL